MTSLKVADSIRFQKTILKGGVIFN